MTRASNGKLYVDFKKASVAETVRFRLRSLFLFPIWHVGFLLPWWFCEKMRMDVCEPRPAIYATSLPLRIFSISSWPVKIRLSGRQKYV